MNTAVIEFLTANPNSNKGQISEAIGIKGLPLFHLLKQMTKDGQIVSAGDGPDATYSVVEPKSEEVKEETPSTETPEPIIETPSTETPEDTGEQPEDKETPASSDKKDEQTETEEEKEESAPKSATPRNNDKFKFNGEELGKGPLVRTIIAKYVKDNPNTTYAKLLEIFPTTLLKRFGVVEEMDKAREISGKKYDRYFFKEEHVIKLKDKKVVVCNQWTTDNIQPFLKVARELGFIIE